MKILTWNINGIRTCGGKTSVKTLLDSLAADVICLQETKVTRDMLDEPTAIVEGYEAYFSFSRKRSGYSGTVNYCQSAAAPVKAEEGLTGRLSAAGGLSPDSLVTRYSCTQHLCDADVDALDAEGRCVITQHSIRLPDGTEKHLAIINVYVPLAGEREDRREYKVKFLGLLQGRAEALLDAGIHVIILGDLNLTHKQIDNCEPDTDETLLIRSSRIWMNNMLRADERDLDLPATNEELVALCPSNVTGGRFSDIFRWLHPWQKHAYTCWCTATEARRANFGRRLDYILVDSELAKLGVSCEVLAHVEGSDHCPVVLELDCRPVASVATPGICASLMPEFRGQQQKLSNFFSKASKCDDKMQTTNVKNVDIDAKAASSTSEVKESGLFLKSQSSQISSNSGKLKRSRSSQMTNSNGKSAKIIKTDSGSKQASLTSFFSKPAGSNKKNIDRQSGVENSTADTKSYNFLCNNNIQDIPNISATPTEQSTTTAADVTLTDESTKPQLKAKATSSAWKSLLGGLPPPPLCPGHKEPCVLKTVKKSGPNRNKQFYSCARPDGPPGKSEFRCNFFLWLHDRQKKKAS